MSVLSLSEDQSLGIHIADMDMEDEADYRSPLFEKYGAEIGEEEVLEEEEDLLKKADGEVSSKDRKQLWLIYSLHLAEAYVHLSPLSCSDILTDVWAVSLHRVFNRSYISFFVIASYVEASTLHTGLAWLRRFLPLVQLRVSSPS